MRVLTFLLAFLTVSAWAVPPGNALDDSALSFTTGGDAPWFYQTAISSDGVDAAQSGGIGNGESSWIETTLTGPGTLSFQVNVSSEAHPDGQGCFDMLSITLDGQPANFRLGVNFICGNEHLELPFQSVSIDIPAGVHTVRWTFSKDVSVSVGHDAAWLDQVRFTSTSPIDPPGGEDPPADDVAPQSRDTRWQVAEIYLATMGYAPDAEGLGYWANNIDVRPEWNPTTVAQSFFDQPLVQLAYPESMGHGPLIDALYRNIFGRDADRAGYDYWLGELQSGRVQRNQMIVALINGGWANAAAATDMARFGNRIRVAQVFADEQDRLGILYSVLSVEDQLYLRDAGRAVLADIGSAPEDFLLGVNRIPALLDRLVAGVAPDLVELAVSPFGAGRIIDAASGIECREHPCTYQFTRGARVELDAVADPSWRFMHWNGCDTVTDGRCIVELSADRMIYPTFAASAPPELHPNVVVLDANSFGKLQSASGSTLIFDASATEIAALPPGTVIVSTRNEGFARQVSSVNTYGSSVFVETEAAALEDIVRAGTLAFTRTLTPDDAAEIRMAPGVRMMTPRAESGDGGKFTFQVDQVVYDDDGNIATDDDQVRVRGTVTFRITPDIAVDVGPLVGLREFRSVIHQEQEYRLDVIAGGNVVSPFNKEHLFSLAWIKFHPIIVGPLVIVPVVKGFVAANGEIKVQLATGASVKWRSSGGVHYRRDHGWAGISDSDFAPDFQPPQLTGTASLDVSTGTYSQLKLFGVAGPFAQVGPYMLMQASSSVGFEEQCGKWNAYLGGRIKAGAEGKILAWSLARFEATVFDRRWKLGGDEVGSCRDTVAPSTPGRPAVAPLSGTQLIVRFEPADDDVGVERYELYRAVHGTTATFLAATDNTVFFDDGLTHASRYCYYVVAVDGAGNRSLPGDVGCGAPAAQYDTMPPTKPGALTIDVLSSGSARLAWTASSDDVGVAGYLVVRDDLNQVVDQTELSSHVLVGLNAGQRYCFRVIAFDQAGNESASSEMACATMDSSESARWRMRIKCADRLGYVLEARMDIEEDWQNHVNVAFEGVDYDGGEIFAVLSGLYDPSSISLDGRIDTAFGSSSCLRSDLFSIDLSLADSGDVPMSQVNVCGCDGAVRFDRVSGADRSLGRMERADVEADGPAGSDFGSNLLIAPVEASPADQALPRRPSKDDLPY